jgi:hypothetical protein
LKRKDLIAEIFKYGFTLKRHGNEHDIYTNGKYIEPIPRHTQINEITAGEIIKRCKKRFEEKN